MSDHDAAFLTRLPWRTGRRVGRTIYAEYGAGTPGTLIGVMDTPELAAEAVFAHNAILAVRPFQDGREVP